MTELQVNAFSGASNLPIWVAQREGMFARRGIEVTLSSPRSSVDQFKGLVDGRYPIVVTAFDNVVAYQSGQGAAEVGTIPDLTAVMGIDRAFLTLVASSGITTIPELKNRTLAVDALSTGFSFAFREILLNAGVNASDVAFVAVGNSENRWKAIQEGRAQAALLTLPTDLTAMDQGGTALTTVAESFGQYLGNVVALRQAWAAGHRTEIEAFVRGIADAVAWLDKREHKARALEIMQTNMPALNATARERIYDALLHPGQGLIRSGALNPEGARTVLALRAKHAPSAQPLRELSEYIDTRYLPEDSSQ